MKSGAYYNEINPFAVAWLQKLISKGLIADGFVDKRSIERVKPKDLEGYTQCHFFAGIGVWSYALKQAGWPDNREVWTGSCPCQPFSVLNGEKAKGVNDERHLWPDWYNLIEECRPITIFGEQVARKGGYTWLDIVLKDLYIETYRVGVCDTSASCFGAPHGRQRLYFVADSENITRNRADGRMGKGIDTGGSRTASNTTFWSKHEWVDCRDHGCGKVSTEKGISLQREPGPITKRPIEPGTFPLVDGAAQRVGRLDGYGNALCAPQAQAFIEAYLEIEGEQHA
jgi:DNA (cytosine-5)-methyltransferase 1